VAGGEHPDLSAFQLEVARLFFALPASKGFLLCCDRSNLERSNIGPDQPRDNESG
jgi:hypothetical protein